MELRPKRPNESSTNKLSELLSLEASIVVFRGVRGLGPAAGLDSFEFTSWWASLVKSSFDFHHCKPFKPTIQGVLPQSQL